MESLLDFIKHNQEWIFSGIGSAILGALAAIFAPKAAKSIRLKFSASQSNQQNNTRSHSNVGRDNYGIINSGSHYTYSEIKEIAKDTVANKLTTFTKEAEGTLIVRVEEIMRDIYREGDARTSLINAMADPSFQIDLAEAAKSYAKSGDQNLKSVLVELLINRSAETERSITQLATSEAIELAKRLTSSQIGACSILFTMKYTWQHDVRSRSELKDRYHSLLEPIIQRMGPTSQDLGIRHLAYTRAIAESPLQQLHPSLDDLLVKYYESLLTEGVEYEVLQPILLKKYKSEDEAREFLSKHFETTNGTPQHYKMKQMNYSELSQYAESEFADQELHYLFKNIHSASRPMRSEFEEAASDILPNYEYIKNIWTHQNLRSYELTTGGLALALADIQAATGTQYHLSDWINDRKPIASSFQHLVSVNPDGTF